MNHLLIAGAAAAFLTGAASADNHQPIPVQRESGERCPSGTVGEPGWCVPERAKQVIRADGRPCPDGWVAEGSVCTRD
jgi:hypothetical protein